MTINAWIKSHMNLTVSNFQGLLRWIAKQYSFPPFCISWSSEVQCSLLYLVHVLLIYSRIEHILKTTEIPSPSEQDTRDYSPEEGHLSTMCITSLL